MIALLAAALAADDPFLGPLPPGTELLGTDAQSHYVRYRLRTDREFVLELTARRPGATAVCSGGGFDLWVRLDLAAHDESFVWDPLPTVVENACARLADFAPALVDAPPVAEPTPGPAKEAWGIPPWRPQPLHLVVIAFSALLAAALPRDRTAIGLGVLALVVRAVASPRWVLLGGDAAYERLVSAGGGLHHDARYGDGWAAIAGLVGRASGASPHAMNIVASALTVPALVMLVRGLNPRAATAAGALLALLPLPIALAGMEDAFVLVGLLQIAALGALSRPWLAAIATGLLAHLRPEQAIFCLLPLGLLAARRAWTPLATGSLLCLARWWELLGGGEVPRSAGILGLERWFDPAFLARLAVPERGAPVVAWDPFVTPLALAILAIAGVILAPRRVWAIPAAALLLSLALYVPKDLPRADPYRFQLPTMALWAALAGIGLTRIRRPWVGVAALVLTAIVARDPLGGGWAWQHEHRFLVDRRGEVPEGTVVLYRADGDPHHAFGRWLNAGSPGDWQPLGTIGPVAGAWLYRGTADRIAAIWPPIPCALEPERVTTVPSATDGWIELGPEPVELGFYRILRCDPAP